MNDDYLLDETRELPPRPPFLKRLWMVFGTPGELFAALAQNPAWFPMALFVAALSGLSMTLLPVDRFMEAAVQGQSPAEAAQTAEAMAAIPPMFFKGAAIGGSVLFMLVLPVIISLVTYVVFVFIRGDEARFKQHLAVAAHAGVIMAVGSVPTMAVVVWGGGALDEGLSVGTLLPFLPEGYLANVLKSVELFGLWAVIVMGIGIAAIDPRRRTGSTVAVMLVLTVVMALVRGAF